MVAQCSVLPTSTATALEGTSVATKTGMKDVSIASNSTSCAATILTASDLAGKAQNIENVTRYPIRVGSTNGGLLAPRRLCDQLALSLS